MDNYAIKEIAQSYKGEIGTYAVVSTDGELIYAHAPNQVKASMFGTMLATSFGAAMAAGIEVDSIPNSIVVKSDNSTMHIERLGNDHLVVAKINGNIEERRSLSELVEHLSELY